MCFLLSGLGDNSSWVGESPNLLIKNPTEKGYSSIETKPFTRTNSVCRQSSATRIKMELGSNVYLYQQLSK